MFCTAHFELEENKREKEFDNAKKKKTLTLGVGGPWSSTKVDSPVKKIECQSELLT